MFYSQVRASLSFSPFVADPHLQFFISPSVAASCYNFCWSLFAPQPSQVLAHAISGSSDTNCHELSGEIGKCRLGEVHSSMKLMSSMFMGVTVNCLWNSQVQVTETEPPGVVLATCVLTSLTNLDSANLTTLYSACPSS